LLKRLPTLVVAGLLLWFVIVVTMAGVFRDRLPALALRFAPFDARAQANSGQRLLASPRGRDRAAPARALATAALRRDATVVDAAALLGLSFGLKGDVAHAERSFQYASQLSRRNVVSQLWLLERDVQRNNIPGALSHFDRVLRTSPAMHAMLLPILSSASAEPPIARELNRMLRGRPNWGPDFISALLMQQSNPQALYRVTQGLLRPSEVREREQLGILLTRLTEQSAFDLAWSAYVAARPERRAGGSGLWNGDFAQEPGLAPFDWSFAADATQIPERRLRSGDDFALYLPTGATTEAESARQLVRLAPGRYTISAAVGNVPQDASSRPRLTVRCAPAPSAELARTDFPRVPAGGGRLSASFAVPGNCRYQWISVWVRGAYDRQLPEAPWITGVRIGPAGGAAPAASPARSSSI
jgi:hypothetical protein